MPSVPEKVDEGVALPPADDPQESKEGKKKKNRCLSCKKKVGLTGTVPSTYSRLLRT